MPNLLASAATTISANPKQAAIEASMPNAVFEPFPALPWLAAAFFIISGIMVWVMLRSGKGADYNS